MISRRPNQMGPERRTLVHAAMDAYLGWRDQCDAVREAYGRWTAAADEKGAALAYERYATALDGEERASELYAGLVRHAASISTTALTPGSGLAVSARQGQR
ncbi:MAG TPA: hypothetical protein VGO14_00625 [Solirubrobacteraceae bacterium]|jgi:hypothetical protein|nr:hypothetical protein [Solirubrobacteraceae bacterium]